MNERQWYWHVILFSNNMCKTWSDCYHDHGVNLLPLILLNRLLYVFFQTFFLVICNWCWTDCCSNYFFCKYCNRTSNNEYTMTARQNSPPGRCKSQLQHIPLAIVKQRLYIKICFLVNPPFLQVGASSACQFQCHRLKQTRQQMITLHKYKHKITRIIIQCTLNGQYFIFVRKNNIWFNFN